MPLILKLWSLKETDLHCLCIKHVVMFLIFTEHPHIHVQHYSLVFHNHHPVQDRLVVHKHCEVSPE